MKIGAYLFCTLVLSFIVKVSLSQSATPEAIAKLPEKIFQKVQPKTAYINKQLMKQSRKYIARLAHTENKIRRKISRKDSAASARLFKDYDERYEALLHELDSARPANRLSENVYSARIDSMRVALDLFRVEGFGANVAGSQKELSLIMNEYHDLQAKLNVVFRINKQIKERKEYLSQQLEKYNVGKYFKGYQKQAYYYRAQMQVYKNILEDPSRAEAKILDLALRVPAFKDFFNKHSQLASIFRLPGSEPPLANAGLQSRATVMRSIEERLGSSANLDQRLQQGMESAQSSLQSLKNKLPVTGNSNADMEDSGFAVNNQKTKRFWDRMEFGSNIQTVKSTQLFPVTSDIGLSAGYKLNDKSVIGIGASYKMGWGKDIRAIRITHEGLGLRSFLDWKIRGGLYASGGLEYNYQKLPETVQRLNDADNWQQSGLVGFSKIVSVNNTFFKKTKIQLLWDFLSYQQTPRSQPIKFRVGYNF